MDAGDAVGPLLALVPYLVLAPSNPTAGSLSGVRAAREGGARPWH